MVRETLGLMLMTKLLVSALFSATVGLILIDWTVPAPEATADRVREAVERSLVFLEQQGQSWIDEHNCVTCYMIDHL